VWSFESRKEIELESSLLVWWGLEYTRASRNEKFVVDLNWGVRG
jgi:hypothetical protein